MREDFYNNEKAQDELEQRTLISCNESYVGETIETKVERVTTQNEPITNGAPIIFTERKDGVLPEYDCRTDRFEVAIDAMDVIQKSAMAKRMNRVQQNEPKDGVAEPIQATT